MKKEDKKEIIDILAQKVGEYNHFYLADIGGLDAENTSKLRRKCFEKDIELVVVKNTLFQKALELSEGEYEEVYGTLKGETSVMFCNTGNVPAKLIKEFRKGSDKPILKSAYVEEAVYVGDNQIDALCAVKSKDELVADVIGLLQSPAKNVVSALQSSGSILHGVLKTLGEKKD